MLNSKNIAFVGAHPDDIEVGCGGIIKKFLNLDKNVYFIVCSKGEKSSDPEIKLQEMKKSTSILGLKDENLFVLNLPDSMIPDGVNTVTTLEDIFKKINPEIIFVTPSHDRHQDHKNVSNATIVAARNLKCTILFYETVSSIETFVPNAFIDISDVINAKIDAIKQYKNLSGKILDFISTVAKFRGHQAKTEYAEGFETKKLFFSL